MGEVYNLLKDSKSGNKDSVLLIIEKFNPLLNKYCKKLNYDGAKTDLIICLLEVIQNIPIDTNADLQNDNCIVGYINYSIIHKYINLSKKNTMIINNEIELITNIVGENSYSTIDDTLCINELLDKLTEVQKKIIISIYINNISESDLARQMHISRQAINRSKNRALNNLKKYLN